jgi:poly-gamma-glutamate capsule biosynthesis protein CapA/YwtB (metallophosphatase superfamily)
MRRARAMLSGAMALALVATGCSLGGGDRPGASGPDPGVGLATATAPPTTAVTTTTRPPRHFTLAASGDILIHAPIMREAQANAFGAGYNFDPMFDDIRDRISAADFAICHQETPISADNTRLSVANTLSFNAPREIAPALKNAGFDACDTASNHTFDRGVAGVNSTLDVLDANGIQHSGSSRSHEEADQPPIYDVKGVAVGHLAYSYTIANNSGPSTQVPPDAPWLRSMLWPALGSAGILMQARQLKARGAEFVVVSIHWGDQYVQMPNALQQQVAHELLASPDVDLILGDHVHVVQPCEKIGDKYVIYGMGNFLSNQSPTQAAGLKLDNEDGTLETFTVNEVAKGQLKVTSMVYTPTWVNIPGHHVVPATPETQPASYQRTTKAMGALGPGACDATPAF